jgi:carboxylesterase
MNAGMWLTVGALAAARVAYARVLEARHAAKFAMNANGIVQGAESIDLPRTGGPAVLLLHGGGDTPQSVAQLAQFLFERGYSVRAPLLARHGRSLEELTRADAGEWRAQVRSEYDALRAKQESIFVVGQSVGGALALDLAASHPVKALVLLAPWVAMKPPLQLLARTSHAWGWLFPYLSSRGGSSSIHDPVERGRVLGRGVITPAQLRALDQIAAAAQNAFSKITAPTLTIQSRADQRISQESAQWAFDQLAAQDKKFEWTSGAGHVISVDYGKENVFALTAAWLDAHRS